MIIRLARPGDSAALAALDAQCNPSPWSEKQFAACIGHANETVLLAEQGRELAGLIVWQTILDEAELHLIDTTPDYRRQGVASLLLDHLFKQADAKKIRRIFLEVRHSNRAAIAALRPDAEERLVVAGTANLARSTPDFSSLGPLLDAIEEQVVLLRLFTNDAPAGENRMRVSIGSENNDDALAEASVVTTTYGPGTGEAVAHLGVIGPTRMDYPATMTAVRAVARYLSRFLSPPET